MIYNNYTILTGTHFPTWRSSQIRILWSLPSLGMLSNHKCWLHVLRTYWTGAVHNHKFWIHRFPSLLLLKSNLWRLRGARPGRRIIPWGCESSLELPFQFQSLIGVLWHRGRSLWCFQRLLDGWWDRRFGTFSCRWCFSCRRSRRRRPQAGQRSQRLHALVWLGLGPRVWQAGASDVCSYPRRPTNTWQPRARHWNQEYESETGGPCRSSCLQSLVQATGISRRFLNRSVWSLWRRICRSLQFSPSDLSMSWCLRFFAPTLRLPLAYPFLRTLVWCLLCLLLAWRAL